MRNFFTLLIGLLLSITVSAQQKVSGYVKAASNGSPVSGATVVVKGTNEGAFTDANGFYNVNIPTNGKSLVFSMVGYKPKEIAINGKSTIDASLEVDLVGLDEVVVIGYSSTKKRDLLGAVSTIKVGDAFNGRPSSIGSILQGQVAGVNITQSGDPTSGVQIDIRGRGNRNGDAVLFVVDGVPGAPYNPADVESVTVLKDASSAAIYGAFAGSGGVILITTKQAKVGKISVDASAWTGYQDAWRLPKVLTAEQYNTAVKTAYTAAGKTVPKTYDPAQYPDGNITRTDWIDEIFRTGKVQHYDVNISGGSNELKTLASFSYDRKEGTIITSYAEKLTARMQTNFTVNKWLSLGQTLLYDYSNGRGGVGDGHTGTIFGAMAYPRFATVYENDADGNQLWGGTIARAALAKGFSVEADLRNPVAMLMKVRQNNPTNRLFSVTSLKLNLMPGLVFKSDFSYDVSSTRNESFQQKFLEPGRTIDQNYRNISNNLYSGWNLDNILSYTKTFAEKHSVSAMGGFLINKKNNRYTGTEVRGFSFEDQYYGIFTNGTDWTTKPTEDIWDESFVSVLGRASYSYNNKYSFSGSLRRDASSKLNPANNSDIFPAVSGSWKISEESFLKDNNAISFLKLRASWGQVGNISSVRRFIYAPSYQVTNWPVFLGSNAQVSAYGIYQPTIPNPDLKWERTEQINIGLDASFFDNSLNMTFDFFDKQTKDLIEAMPVPSVAGIASAPEFNIGQVQNRGWEFSLNYTKRDGQVDLNIAGNVGHFTNKVSDIGPNAFISHSNGVNSMNPLQSKVGQPWYSYYLIHSLGIFRSQGEVDGYVFNNGTKIQPNAKPGDLKFEDFNKDGIINDGDRQYMGAYDVPDFSYGFNLGAAWKGLSVNAFFQGVYGVNAFNGVKAMTLSGLKGWNLSTDALDSYNYNPNSNTPNLAMAADANGNFSKVSDFFLEKADYLRLKSLNIGYTLSPSLSKRIDPTGKMKIKFYINGENLLTFTKYSAFDPEVGNLGVDGGRFPVSKMTSIGINVTF